MHETKKIKSLFSLIALSNYTPFLAFYNQHQDFRILAFYNASGLA